MTKFKNLKELINKSGESAIIYLKNNKIVIVTNYEKQNAMIIMRYNDMEIRPEWSKVYNHKEKYINALKRFLKQQ